MPLNRSRTHQFYLRSKKKYFHTGRGRRGKNGIKLLTINKNYAVRFANEKAARRSRRGTKIIQNLNEIIVWLARKCMVETDRERNLYACKSNAYSEKRKREREKRKNIHIETATHKRKG